MSLAKKIFKLQLHWKILIAMVLGVFYGALAIHFKWENFTQDWIAPWGAIFLKSLKLVAVPLVLLTLITGVAGLSDATKLGKIGVRSIVLYLSSTVIAISIGLVAVNVLQPWEGMSPEITEGLLQSYPEQDPSKLQKPADHGPLTFLQDMVPENIFFAASSNKNILQVIFFSILFGVSLLAIPKKSAVLVNDFFDGLSKVIIQMVNYIMLFAPYGTFALIASLLVDVVLNAGIELSELLYLLSKYGLTVILALAFLVYFVYPLVLRLITKKSSLGFLKKIRAAQLLAFSTSSSAAVLPISLETAQKKLNVSKESAGFVLPLGATINMDGTSCYQAIAAVFIANVMGVELSFMDQLTIVFTTLLASIGTASIPGAGIVMLAIVLGQLKIPVEGIAIIIGVDRILDMCRTVVNVTGDLAICTIVDYLSKKDAK